MVLPVPLLYKNQQENKMKENLKKAVALLLKLLAKGLRLLASLADKGVSKLEEE